MARNPRPADELLALAEQLGALLAARGWTLATAESCTAGGIGFAVTQVPGSSRWFEQGFITYSNAAKMKLMRVPAADLRSFGAVSEPVARAMALGALQRARANVAVAVTGIAGPDGGTAAKPVGTVCFAWAVDPMRAGAPRVTMATEHFDGDRAAVRVQAITEALRGAIAAVRD